MSGNPADPTPHRVDKSVFRRYLRPHMAIFAAMLICVLVLYQIAPAERGLFIPMLLWAVLVLVHYLTVRALDPDQGLGCWTGAVQITMNATDLSHIESIRTRHENRIADSKLDVESHGGNADRARSNGT